MILEEALCSILFATELSDYYLRLGLSVPKHRLLWSATAVGLAAIVFSLAALRTSSSTATRHNDLVLRVDSLARLLTHLASGYSSRSARDTAIIDARGYASRGRADAPVILIEFTDYQCPFCRRAAAALDSVATEYIARGFVRHIVRDYPLSRVHAQAQTAAAFARCIAAADTAAYWRFRNALYERQGRLSEPGYFLEQTVALGLSGPGIEDCTASPETAAAIARDVAAAQRQNIRGTPAFIIGVPVDGTVRGVVLNGALPFTDFRGHIEAAIARSNKQLHTPGSKEGDT